MKKKVYPLPLYIGEYVTERYSHTKVTWEDNTATLVQEKESENYSVFQPIAVPKGPTNTLIKFQGGQALTKFNKIFGNLNTLIHGKSTMYAKDSIFSGFDVYVINVRDPKATHANMYISLDIRMANEDDNKLAGTPGAPLTQKLYVQNDTTQNLICCSWDKSTLNSTDPVEEIDIPKITIGFTPNYIEDLRDTTILTEYMPTLVEAKVKDGDVIDSNSSIHIPLFCLGYTGASTYGNNFKVLFSDTNTLANEKYPITNIEIQDNGETEFSYGFTNFSVNYNGDDYAFDQRTESTCNIKFNSNNTVDLFRGWSIDRTTINKVGPKIAEFKKVILAHIEREIKSKFGTFDPTNDTITDYMDTIKADIDTIFGTFQTPTRGTGETYISRVNMFIPASSGASPFIMNRTLPKSLDLLGGSDGLLQDVLDVIDFDFEQTVDDGSGTPYKIYEDLYKKAFLGELDARTKDAVYLWDTIIFDEEFPLDLQTALAEYTRYREGLPDFRDVRCDWHYAAAPQFNRKTTQSILSWGKQLGVTKNVSMSLWMGRGKFYDESTGAQIMYNLYKHYIGPGGSLYPYLISGSTKSFASTEYSEIVNVNPNSFECIPSDIDFKDLEAEDFIYYKRNGNKNMVMANDATVFHKYTSGRKYVGSSIHWNRIQNIAYRIMELNPIKSTTSNDLKILQDDIEKAIAGPAKHFGGMVTVRVSISDKEEELDKNVVLAQIDVTTNKYSKTARIKMVANNPAAE